MRAGIGRIDMADYRRSNAMRWAGSYACRARAVWCAYWKNLAADPMELKASMRWDRCSITGRLGRHIRMAVIAALLFGPPFTPLSAQQAPPDESSVLETIQRLKPGEFLWMPDVAPSGPVLIIISLANQRAVAYRNGVPIGVSTVSSRP